MSALNQMINKTQTTHCVLMEMLYFMLIFVNMWGQWVQGFGVWLPLYRPPPQPHLVANKTDGVQSYTTHPIITPPQPHPTPPYHDRWVIDDYFDKSPHQTHRPQVVLGYPLHPPQTACHLPT